MKNGACCTARVPPPSTNLEEAQTMTRKTTADFHPEVMKLFDQYVHGQLS